MSAAFEREESAERADMTGVWAEFQKNTENQVLRDRLITNYLHLVKYVVGRLVSNLPSHVKMDDLFSTGVLGLMKAIEKYDATKKNKFETYAILLIKGAIIDEMRSLDWVPRSVHQKANRVGKVKAELEQRLGREATDGEMAKALEVSVTEYHELLNKTAPAIMVSMDLDTDPESERGPMVERIADENAPTAFETADRNEFRKMLERAVTDLPEQERTVLVLYYYENLMLKEIGKVMNVSESRVSQIHTKALSRLKTRLHGFNHEFSDLV